MTIKKTIAILGVLLLTALAAGAQYSALDPTRLIPDARVIGLGKAYVGLAEGTAAIYTNPAGLADNKGWEITSMSGKFIDEYDYLSFSGFYPTNLGVFGLAYAGTSIAGAWATTIESGSDPLDPIYTFDFSQPQISNKNSVIALSYGNQASAINYINKLPLADRISLGTTAKFFNASLAGDSITGGDASGFDMDLGAKFYPPQKWVTLGGTLRNFLPSSMGGKLHYSSGHDEAYNAVLQLGSAFQVLGKKDAVAKLGDHDLKLMLDTETYPTLTNYPWTLHAALEWKPFPLLAIRAGIDQDAIGNENGGLDVVSDNTFGVGLNYGGFSFDYAYHTFAGMPEVDNHYFSLSYAVQPPAEVAVKLKLTSPEDKLITFESRALLAGVVLDPFASKLTVNGAPLKFGLKGDFSLPVELKTGKNKFVVVLFDSSGKSIYTDQRRALRLITFPDVFVAYWVAKPISLLAMQKVITGYPNGTFKPEGNITRAEMCSLLMKSQNTSSESQIIPKFKDINPKHWAAAFIARAADQKIVLGYPDGTFKPAGNITRAEGLAMIARFAGISEEVYTGQFADVAGNFWAARTMSGAYKAGLLEYLKGKNFEPKKALTRSETVEMLYRTQTVQDILAKDLLSWDSY